MVFGQYPRASELEYAGSLSRLISDFTADMFTTGNFSRYVNFKQLIFHSIPILSPFSRTLDSFQAAVLRYHEGSFHPSLGPSPECPAEPIGHTD